MINEQLKKARELIQTKRLDEARELLSQIDHPTARAWLDKIDSPSNEVESSKAKIKTGAPQVSSTQTILLSTVVLMMGVILLLMIYNIFIKEDTEINFSPIVDELNEIQASVDSLVQATEQPEPIETEEPDKDNLNWEYLILTYNQFDVDLDDNREVLYYTSYGERFDKDIFGETPCDFGVNLDEDDIDCLEDSFISLTDVMNILGEDSWEFIQLVNNSDQYTYSVEVFFERPR